jgi:hypothetical protein
MEMRLAEVLAEPPRTNKELLNGLANAVGANEKAQRRFRAAVLTRWSTIEARLAEVQGTRLVDFWPPGRVSDEPRDKVLQKVEERVSKPGNELGIKSLGNCHLDPLASGTRK